MLMWSLACGGGARPYCGAPPQSVPQLVVRGSRPAFDDRVPLAYRCVRGRERGGTQARACAANKDPADPPCTLLSCQHYCAKALPGTASGLQLLHAMGDIRRFIVLVVSAAAFNPLFAWHVDWRAWLLMCMCLLLTAVLCCGVRPLCPQDAGHPVLVRQPGQPPHVGAAGCAAAQDGAGVRHPVRAVRPPPLPVRNKEQAMSVMEGDVQRLQCRSALSVS